MTHLDPKALEVSAAMHDHWERDKRTIGSRNALRNSAEVISAYLAALPQAEPVATMHTSETETIFSKGWVPGMIGFTSSPLFASPFPPRSEK